MKCVAIDDEPIALRIIEEFCSRIENIELQTFSDAMEGLDEILKTKPDLIFLDIEIGDSNGLRIAARLSDLSPKPNVIFTTAYPQYAVDGFNLDAVDYLHKPFSFERFKEAIERAKRRQDYAYKAPDRKEILVKCDYNNVPVKLSEILYIEAMENYSKLYLDNGKMILAHNSLKSLHEMLYNMGFMRIHKSFIVPKTAISSFNRQSVFLNGGAVLPIGRRHYPHIFEVFNRTNN